MLLYYFYIFLVIIKVAYSQRFVYPDMDDFEMDCSLPDGSAGLCRNIKYCPTALTGRQEPTTCYFEKFEHFVCCREEIIGNTVKRRSRKACDDYYPIRHFIVLGLPTVYEEYPYMIALGWESILQNAYDYKCGGVLISPEFVLTAAHCANVNGLAPAVALPGGLNLTDSSAESYRIAKIIIHPDYNALFSYHDIALMRLEKAVVNFKPACLWPNYALDSINMTAIGYGHTRFAGASSDQLLKAYLTIVMNKECQSFYKTDTQVPNGISEKQICAKDPQQLRDTCQGDSGGPIILPKSVSSNIIPNVVGITSFGQGCATNAPGVYTRISEYVDWIESIVWPI